MQYYKVYRLIVLILVAVLLFSGCKDSTSFILPPESTTDQLQSMDSTQPEDQNAVTAPTIVSDSTESTAETTADPTESQPKATLPPPAGANPGTDEHRHSYTATVVPPTCANYGYTEHTCSCGDNYTDDRKEPLGHNYNVTTVPSTTSQWGYDQYQCTRCSNSYKDNYTEPLPSGTNPAPGNPPPEEHKHSYTKTVIDPTCTTYGYTEHTCACGHSYSNDRREPLGHNYNVITVPPTTSQRGYDLHQCIRCSNSYKDHYTEPLPSDTSPTPGDPPPEEHKHSYTKTVVAPTCTTDGYTAYTCACGDSYQTDRKSALGHDYRVTTVSPTVDQQGYSLHECTRCGYSYKDSYVDKLPPETEPPETELPETEPPASHPVYDISGHVVGSLEYEILAEINAHRAAEGLSELKMDKKLCALAAIRAYEASISFSHTRPDGRSCFTVFNDYNYSASAAGENLLYCSPSYSASQLVDTWMQSAGHRDNILSSDFRAAGIGIYQANGRLYVANLFVG